MEPTYFITAAALVLAFITVYINGYGGYHPLARTALLILSFWGGIEALVAWGFLHSPL